jgi:hypothetical protein
MNDINCAQMNLLELSSTISRINERTPMLSFLLAKYYNDNNVIPYITLSLVPYLLSHDQFGRIHKTNPAANENTKLRDQFPAVGASHN